MAGFYARKVSFYFRSAVYTISNKIKDLHKLDSRFMVIINFGVRPVIECIGQAG